MDFFGHVDDVFPTNLLHLSLTRHKLYAYQKSQVARTFECRLAVFFLKMENKTYHYREVRLGFGCTLLSYTGLFGQLKPHLSVGLGGFA